MLRGLGARADLGQLRLAPLAQGDTVELQGTFRAADGYFAADHTSFWGCKVGCAAEGRSDDTTRSDQGFVRMPDAEFEAILTRTAEEGAKRALADIGLDGEEAAPPD